MKNPSMDDPETLNRRLRLNELIQECFGGYQKELIAHINARNKKPANQGELSSLRKLNNQGKSFGYVKAGNLAKQIGLNRRWFEFPLGTNLAPARWMSDTPQDPYDLPPTTNIEILNDSAELARLTLWPFKRVSHERVMALSAAQREFIEGALLMAVTTCEAENSEKQTSPAISGQQK
jgi:hypothetical protein